MEHSNCRTEVERKFIDCSSRPVSMASVLVEVSKSFRPNVFRKMWN